MARRANFINEYGKANPDQRARIIFLNYTSFPDIIEGYEQKIIIRIMDEINRARRDEIGDLGDRVNMSEHYVRNMVSQMKADIKEQLADEYRNMKWEA